MSDDPPEVNPGTTVPTPPTAPPNPSLFPQAHPIIDTRPSHPVVIPPNLPPPSGLPAPPPVVVDEPYAAQEDTVMTCTMGNWENEPTAYFYQWQRDRSNIQGVGAGSNRYPVAPEDVGHTLACIVTALGDGGVASATSNIVVVVAPTLPPAIKGNAYA